MQGLANNQQSSAPANRTSTIDVPVRILVPSESVGAIIGKGGQTIRQLTQQTRAKVDVYRGDPMAPSTALQEKVITIRGQPENCINACREILKVMKADAESKGKASEMPLKVLAHNDYIGRIIGKQGNIINTIKKETETTVTVSSINDISMNVERVITVKGELENMIRALEIIHSKVKQAFENDTKTYGAQAIMMGGIPPIPLAPPAYASSAAAAAAAAAYSAPNSAARYAAAAAAAAAVAQQQGSPHLGGTSSNPGSGSQGANGTPSGAGNPNGAAAYPYYPPMYGAPVNVPPGALAYSNQGAALLPQQSQAVGQLNNVAQGGLGVQHELINQGPEPETVYLYIPNVAVGAIIGTKGSFIKNIIKLSGASVKITPLSPEESKTAVERQVVIVGTSDSQWKAQYYIYEKIRQERFTSDENVKLRAEVQVPSQIVGRIIGKSGKNVRELQRTTGATIKLPEDATNQQQQQQQQSESAAASGDENGASSNAPAVVATPAAQPSSESGEQKEDSPSPTPASQSANQSGFVTVRIYGTFQASQLAQRRIQGLVAQSRGLPDLSLQQTRILSNVTNYQAFQMPIANSYQQRGEYPVPQRVNGNAYNRRNRNQQQANKNNNSNEQVNKDTSVNHQASNGQPIEQAEVKLDSTA